MTKFKCAPCGYETNRQADTRRHNESIIHIHREKIQKTKDVADESELTERCIKNKCNTFLETTQVLKMS